MPKSDDEITVREVEQRLKATLAGAFSGGPTQLKNIPKTREPKEPKPKGKP